jgi:hypothetical protein
VDPIKNTWGEVFIVFRLETTLSELPVKPVPAEFKVKWEPIEPAGIFEPLRSRIERCGPDSCEGFVGYLETIEPLLPELVRDSVAEVGKIPLAGGP